MKDVIAKVLPVSKKRTALEEAEWEDEGSEGALERELMLQCELRSPCTDTTSDQINSDGDTTRVSSQSGPIRPLRHGSRICSRSCASSFGRLSRPES